MKSLSSPEICSARRVSRPGAASRSPPRFVEFRPRLDQDAECGRVDELDLAEIHDDPLRSVGTGLVQRGAHLGCVVEVELAAQANNPGGAHGVHAKHRVLAQAVPSDVPPVSQPPSWLAFARSGWV